LEGKRKTMCVSTIGDGKGSDGFLKARAESLPLSLSLSFSLFPIDLEIPMSRMAEVDGHSHISTISNVSYEKRATAEETEREMEARGSIPLPFSPRKEQGKTPLGVVDDESR
jgi:hypothetical protein